MQVCTEWLEAKARNKVLTIEFISNFDWGFEIFPHPVVLS